jgi:predicted methyltransferase
MRALWSTGFVIAALCVSRLTAASDIKPYLASALADPARSADTKDDARRKPGPMLAFSGVKPGDKVVDLIPGGGYFTRILSKTVGDKGHVFVVWPDEYAKVAHPDPENSKKLAATPGFGNITVLEQPAAAFATPEPVDMVLTVQNYHDYPDEFMGKVDPIAFDRAVFKSLKPGGIFLVVDHVAAAGSGLRDTDTLHRIDPAIVKKELAEVGFEFVGESSALRNPADDHTKKVFDPSIRGHTDQFIYKFRRPK